MRYHPFLFLFFLAACQPDSAPYHGYAEGEYIYVAPTTGGVLAKLAVQRGQNVASGASLFALDLTQLNAQARAAQAAIDKAQAARDLAEKDEARARALVPVGGASRAEWDAQKAALARATADCRAAKQEKIQIDQQRADAAPSARAAARVEDTFFREGEYVAAGTPVVSLLPAENVKVLFFVPEAALPHVLPGTKVRLRCDGCAAPRAATVSFVASQSEYTPPVIFSVGAREKLVYRVEAHPDETAPLLHPGQPIDVEILP
jgi:HlyD family secretion protein